MPVGDPERCRSPVTVQNTRTMLLTRAPFNLDDVLKKYKQLHGGRQERQAGRRLRAEPEPDNGAPAPPPDSERRDWAKFQPRGPQTYQERILQWDKEQKLQEAIASGNVRALEKLRNTDECPEPECKRKGVRLEVTPDGDAVCPSCGYTKENVAEEMDSGGTQIVNLTDKRTFEDGPDNRKNTELVEQQENNIKLYVIQPNDAPGASDDQIWWANNRMNQSMLWADLMGADFGMEDGFGISETEIRHVKQLLRQVSIQAAMDLAADFYEGEDDDEEDRDGSDDSLMGQPLLWTILLALHVMTMRPEGFKVATETQQKYATLRDLHAYMKKFAGDQMKMYREQMESFFTNVKGLDAKKAAARMDRIKKRSAVYYPLGADPERLQAKIEKLNELLMQTKGNKDGLAEEVLQDERPELLPLEARRRHVTARDSAVATQDTDTMLVKGKTQRATARSRWGVYTTPVKPDFSKPGDEAKAKGGRGGGGGGDSGGGGEGGGGGGGKRKGKGGTGRGLVLAKLQGEGDNLYDNYGDEEVSDQAAVGGMFATMAKESKDAEARERAEAEWKAKEAEAKKKRDEWVPKSTWEDESRGPSATDNYGEAGGSSSSGPASHPELLELSIEELETMIAEKHSFLEVEEKSGNYSKEEIEAVQQETVRLKVALLEKEAIEKQDAVEMDEELMAQWFKRDDEEAMDVEGDDANNNNDNGDDDNDNNGGIAPELMGEDGEFVSEEAEAAAMVDLLSIDLSDAAFARHQQEQLDALVAQEKRRKEMVEAEREAREAEAARKQAEREAGYDPYNRENDKRNDVEGFIAAGMPIPTPQGNIDGFSGRTGGEYYKSDKQIRALTLKQVQASQNFRSNPLAFVARWQRLQREWRADVEAKVAKFKDLKRQKEESRAKREARAQEVAERKVKEEKRLEAWRLKTALNKDAKYQKQLQKGAGLAVKPSNAPKDKTRVTVGRSGKITVNPKAEPSSSNATKRRRVQCNDCKAWRELSHIPAPGWTCKDSELQCRQKRHCGLCGRNGWGDGPAPPDWKCEDSGEYGCLSPDERKGKYAKK